MIAGSLASATTVGLGESCAQTARRAFEATNPAIEASRIKPVIDAAYRFGEAPRAFEHLGRGPFGKLVIALS